MSQWIWKFGEFEAYHSTLLHSRRREYDHAEPVVWKVSPVDTTIEFRKHVTTEGGELRIAACGDFSMTIDGNGEHLKVGDIDRLTLKAGEYDIDLRISNLKTFPCIYMEGCVETDGSWEADDLTCNWAPVGTNAMYTSADVTPEVFPFVYEPLLPVEKTFVDGGVLYDYGKETFARTEISNLSGKPVIVRFGESMEEATSKEFCLVRFNDTPADGKLTYIPYAFRYIFVGEENAEIAAEYEYLPLECPGAFSSCDPLLDKIWDVARYTFHLNSREFFLDGIKRDRWVWSGDAFQSLYVNKYLFHDAEIEKRTLIALAGKSPFRRHINTIMDYTFFWFINLYEFYQNYGELDFVRQMYPMMKEMMDFCLSRLDPDGFARGRTGDWIFIDWAPMDKTGALCAEQILLARAMECYSELCKLLGKEDDGCAARAKELQSAVMKFFYNAEKGAFIDSYESGKQLVTRQSNLFAYLYLPCSREIKKSIYENVILNKEVREITTPYFKFYENQVYAMEGNIRLLEDRVREYYGAMLECGATSLYEEFYPTMHGAEHYAMYGRPFGKSLCHAWSASPVYLLGRYRLGVKSTGVADATFEVKPDFNGLESFSGTVPLTGGKVDVSFDGSILKVYATKDGGTLIVGDKTMALAAGETVTLAVR